VTILEKFDLFDRGSIAKQAEDETVLEAAGLQKSSWLECLEREFTKDCADPMFPPFMIPYLQHKMQANGGSEVKEVRKEEVEVLASGNVLGLSG